MTDTMQDQQVRAEPSVDEVMGQIVSELGAGLGVLMSALGIRAGLWSALAGAGFLTSADLADRTGVAPALTRDWLRAQAAAGYLRYDAAADAFEVPDGVAVALLQAPGGAMIDACAHMFSSMGAGFAEFTAAFCGSGGYGWNQRTSEHYLGADLLTQATLPAELIGAALDGLGIGDAMAEGGSIADVGCGYGSPTRAIAAHFPAARVLGVDYHDGSVARASDAALASGLGDRVRFEVAAATDLPGTAYSLITFFDSLHDLGDPVGALSRAKEALADDGVVMLVEVESADSVEGNLNPAGRMFYSVSALVCTPNALSQQVPGSVAPIGTLSGESRLRRLAQEAGFGDVRRIPVPAPMNLVLALRK